MRDPELDRILEEWQKADPRDFGQLIRWLTFFARRYEKAKRPADRRFWILQQLDFLSRFGDSLCPGDQLKPVRHLILALMGLDRGVVSPTLMPPYGAYPKPVSEMLFRARMAAAMQMYHESGQKLTGKGRAASLAILHAGTPDIEIGTLENWRQAFLKGDPETDIGTFYYRLWTNPKSGLVVGPSEAASGTDDPQANIDIVIYDLLHPGKFVWSAGGRMRTKAQYAEWLASTASLIRTIGSMG